MTPCFVRSLLWSYCIVSWLYIEFESDDWSDEEENLNPPSGADESTRDHGRIVLLEKKLVQALLELADYRKLVEERFDLSEIDIADDENEPEQSSSKLQPKVKEDDGHYFDSYDEHGE